MKEGVLGRVWPALARPGMRAMASRRARVDAFFWVRTGGGRVEWLVRLSRWTVHATLAKLDKPRPGMALGRPASRDP